MDDLENKIRENVKLVYRVINDLQYIPKEVEIEDLEQVGKIALWQALEKYDENRLTTISTFCYKFIYNQIISYLRGFVADKRRPIMECVTPEQHSVEEEVLGSMLIYEIGKLLSDNEMAIFIDRHVNNLTLNEMSEKYGYAQADGVHKKLNHINKILEKGLDWDL